MVITWLNEAREAAEKRGPGVRRPVPVDNGGSVGNAGGGRDDDDDGDGVGEDNGSESDDEDDDDAEFVYDIQVKRLTGDAVNP